MLFELSPKDMRAACFADLTQVQDVVIDRVPHLIATCPRCWRTIVSHRTASSWAENASAMLAAYEHLFTCGVKP